MPDPPVINLDKTSRFISNQLFLHAFSLLIIVLAAGIHAKKTYFKIICRIDEK